MYAFYTVESCSHTENWTTSGRTREWWVAAEELQWDYAPRETSVITGEDLNDPRE